MSDITTKTPTPDHVPCRNCTDTISWDEISWVHDENGFADCGLKVDPVPSIITPTARITINPAIVATRSPVVYAEPVGEWS